MQRASMLALVLALMSCLARRALGRAVGNRLQVGGVLRAGESLSAGKGMLLMQADGNLVVCAEATSDGAGCAQQPQWETATGGNPGAFAILSSYGCLNVVASGGPTQPGNTADRLWQSHTMADAGCNATSDHCPTELVVSPVGDVMLAKLTATGGFGETIWQTSTIVDAANILMLVVDDLRPQMNKAYHQAYMHTPSLDSLAASGVVMSSAYVQYAVCNPSRNSFLTGRVPDSTMVWNFKNSFRGSGGGPGEAWPTIPSYFKAKGWSTHGGGKLFHPCCGVEFQDWPRSWTNTDDVGYFWFLNRGMDHDSTDPYYERDCPAGVSACPSDEPLESFYDHRLADHTIRTLRYVANASNVTGRPWFVAAGFRRPHNNWRVPSPFWDLYGPTSNISVAKHPYAPVDVPPVAFNDGGFHFADCDNSTLNPNGTACQSTRQKPMAVHYQQEARRGYYASVSFTDSEIGRVLDELHDLGAENNTIVILWGDHGWQLGEIGEWHKHTNFELATRIPLIVRAPGMLAGRRSLAMVEAVDIFPTLADLAGVPLPPAKTDGRSFAALLNDTASSVALEEAALPRAVGPFNASFSQYARCPQNQQDLSLDHSCDGVKRDQITVMGYTIRTPLWRYTAWLPWNASLLAADWSEPAGWKWGMELYNHSSDTGMDLDCQAETVNLAYKPEHNATRQTLHRQLQAHFYRSEAELLLRNAMVPTW